MILPFNDFAIHSLFRQYGADSGRMIFGQNHKNKNAMFYQQEGKRLISVYPNDLPNLNTLLTSKLRLFGCTLGPAD
jgi:hypothetical protein